MRSTVLTVAVLSLCVPAPARAQDSGAVDANIGFGYSAVTGEGREHTGDAGLFEAGITFNASPAFGFQTNYNYTGLGKEKTVTLGVSVNPLPGGATTLQEFSADAHMHDVTFNMVMRPTALAKASPLLIIGPGVYHRTINITTPAVGYTTVCDPYWYACYPTLVSVDQIIGSRSSTDFGMNFGAGVSFKVGETTSIYFNIRYIYIWGPEFDVPAVGTTPARTVGANGQAIPFTVGVRW